MLTGWRVTDSYKPKRRKNEKTKENITYYNRGKTKAFRMPGRSQTAPQLQLNVNWVEDDRLIYT
jgi:hypothetical protein